MLGRRMKLEFKAALWAAAVLLVALAAPVVLAQGGGKYTDAKKMPEGVAGERIRELMEVVNSNDREKVRAFVEKRFTESFRDVLPMEQHIEVVSDLYSQSRGFDFYSIRTYEDKKPPHEYTIIVKNRLLQSWQAFVMHLEPAPPHRIAGLQFSPARPPGDLPPPKKISRSEIAKALEAFVSRLANEDAFSGSILLAKDEKILFKEAYGVASKRFQVPNKIDTKLNLGSMNKMFTGIAIAQLAEAGKLSFDDSLGKFLTEDWLPLEITKKIKIKHLLTHTSGLGNYFNRKFMESSRLQYRQLDDYKDLIKDEKLAFEPGTTQQYSNTGMFLLGVVIEKASGENYFDYIRKNIYEPAGMVNTDCYEMDKPVPNLAIGYSRRGGEWTNNIYIHVVKGGPAGGGFSTVEDLFRFAQAVKSNKLLSPEYTRMVLAGKPELNSGSYGFGFGIYGSPGERIVGHGGGFVGISSNLDIFLDSGFVAVVLSNYDRGAYAVSEKMRELIEALE